jgi:hypothetical protein
MKSRPWAIIVFATFMVAAASLTCSTRPDAFQPITSGAKPWDPPPGWNPQPPCVVGYFVAIDSCDGCNGLSYALCVGHSFNQCVCGGSSWPGAVCPQTFACSADDFPPYNWVEFVDYAGPGWAGLSRMDAGSAQ